MGTSTDTGAGRKRQAARGTAGAPQRRPRKAPAGVTAERPVVGAVEDATPEAAMTAALPTGKASSVAPPLGPPGAPPPAAGTESAGTTGAATGAGADRRGTDTAAAEAPALPFDVDRLASNTARLIEQLGRVGAAYLRPHEQGKAAPAPVDQTVDAVKTLGRLAEFWLRDPARALEAQSKLATGMMTLWSHMLHRLQGETVPAVVEPHPKDARFNDPEWQKNPYFDFLKQAYLLTSQWADELVQKADGLDAHTRAKAGFYVRQLASALAPSNFLATNPELIRTTLAESGENLVRGLKMLAEDIEAGKGDVKLRQTALSSFTVGENLATTPGAVIFRNELIELLQYRPTTERVLAVPLLIVPPWINKFYILDLNPEKSFIRWCVEQGITVFVISWVNPDERHADLDFEGYMTKGILAASDVVRAITGQPAMHVMGYCVGGTLLAVTLAWLAAREDKRFASASFLTTQVDFTHAGDLKLFVDEEQIRAVEAIMERLGYLPGSRMASAFNMLRPLDLIWPYVVNTYIKGKEPAAFDLLYWNSDSTRMPKANHAYYLRHCYLQNDLAEGRMVIGGQPLDLRRVTLPIYNLAAKEDHIAPARSVFVGSQLFGGPVRYVMAGSGHIAGVVNPPRKPKYQYWTGGPPTGTFEAWVAAAAETLGSWWPDWAAWLRNLDDRTVPARPPGSAAFPPLAPAPGDYVRVRA